MTFVAFKEKLALSSSISNRIYYWTVSLEALKQRPLLGYGFDSTAEFFRSTNRPNRFGSTFAADSSHNLLIDIATWIGIPLTFLLVVVIIRVLYKALSAIFIHHPFLSTQKIVFSSLIAFLVQSLISVPTISLNIWGFGLFGCLLILSDSKSFETRTLYSYPKLSKGMRILTTWALILVLPLFPLRWKKDLDFRNLAEAGNGNELINLVDRWPQDSFHYLTLTHSLYLSNQINLGQSVGKRGLDFNPKNYLLLEEMEKQDPDQLFKKEMRNRMADINPLYSYQR
jgi:hypothetical protein